MTTRPLSERLIGTLWVCECCMFVHANGECGDHDHTAGDEGGYGPEPLSRAGDMELSLGIAYEEHAEGCPNGNEDTWGREDCDCETDTFSRSQCLTCGSWLGGTRYAMTAWSRD